ncbi:AraC family transcriptional regulator [Dyadobacter sp. CY261]|uniref:AraC family transcriptional regulator n=1 Tax=Dyadobacter sp. CY261 TaxID=2907203 RepID=UPI001F293E3F|nr:AraC family transcriptional regulator [Dyadobacter sp. CY261]MCF0070613.1 AraC family transcriptional regulator [Dyadobacter sp. CY261]
MNDQQKQFILAFLAYAAQRDLSLDKLCRLSGVDLREITGDRSNPISLKQFNYLWLHACHLSNDPLFGLHLGESLQLAALGMVGEIIKSSTTVGQGVEHAVALTPLVTDLFGMTVACNARSFTLSLIPNDANRAASPFAFEQMASFFMVFAIHELDGLILARIRPGHVTMPFQASAARELERVLRCTPTRSDLDYSITFDNKYWDLPILTANYALQQNLLQKVVAALPGKMRQETWQDRVHQYLVKNAYLGIVSLEEIAANFNVSPRSLQRKLKDEHVTYQELADDVRKSLALHYLESGGYYVKEISYMLGYNELSAFSRAFKRWTGVAPGEYGKGILNE